MSVPTPLRNCWLLVPILSLICLIEPVLSQTEQEAMETTKYIETTLHYKETLRFNVEPLFTKLAKDPRISYENETLQAKQPLLLTKPYTAMHSANLSTLQDCSKIEPLNYSHVQLICNSSREYRIVYNDFSSSLTKEVGAYVVPGNESIYTFSDVADSESHPFVYILSLLNGLDDQ